MSVVETEARARAMTAADPLDIGGHHLSVTTAFRTGDVAAWVRAYEQAASTIGQRAGELTPERLRQFGLLAEQFVRMAELRMAELGQMAFDPGLIAGFADQARHAANIGGIVGDGTLVESGRRLADRFWQVSSPAGGQVRTYWRPDSPPQLQVEPTNHCNLKCTMCPRTTAMTRPLGHMEEDVWRRILSSWSAREIIYTFADIAPGSGFRHVFRGGVRLFFLGEFLMHPNFEAFIRISEELGANVGVQTNGTLLAKRSLRRRLLEAAPRGLTISLDGMDAATYQAVRAGGKWSAVKEAIETFIAERDAAGLAERMPVQLVTILPDETAASRERARAFLGTIAEGRLKVGFLQLGSSNPVSFYNASGEIAEAAFVPDHKVTADRPSCFEPLEKLQVLWDGRISACCNDIDGTIALGHATEGVDAIWQSEPMHRLQRAHLEHRLADYALCQSCLGVDAEARPRALAPA
ncbi:MAG: radical SAM protein [Alphaproteobacteria bacterium]|nr:radical SAM protein [Alphaproteobacteria bacterium]